MLDEQDEREYVVVINEEEQYSIWFADRPLPRGWTQAGRRGKKQECLNEIEQLWVDMRPKSLRRKI